MCQKTLEQFKVKHEIWEKCFSGEDRNSILNQIYQMVWDAAVFKIINEARRISPVNANGQTEINGMLHRFIDRCFFNSQFLTVRRLIDPASLDGARGVFSLVSLLNDMKVNVSLMTRENLFAVEDLEYDSESIEQRELEYATEQLKNGKSSWGTSFKGSSHDIKSRHEQIDMLCEVDAGQRKPSDTIQLEIFGYLIQKLKNASEDVKLHVDKYIAHAATPENREYVKADEVSITLGHLWNAHKVICQVTNLVDVYMLSRAHHSFLPVPQFNHLEFIDKPLVSTVGVEALSKEWDKFQAETDSWGQLSLKDLQQEMTKA